MNQMARNLTDAEDGFLRGKRYLIHDRDPLFTKEFREALSGAGVKSVKLPPRSPNLNANAERFVRTIKESCLDRMIFFSEASLRRAIEEFAALAGDRRNPAETALGWGAELLLSGSGLTHKLFLMRAVNRSAVVVVPKQPFLDWLHRVDSSSGKLTLTDLANDPSIYLLPECDLESELELHFEKACPKIFEDQLNGWYRAEFRSLSRRTGSEDNAEH